MSGYTDEVAEECHDLIEHAEEEAHMLDDQRMAASKSKKKSGLESSSGSGGSDSQISSGDMSTSMSQKKEDMKEALHMK